MATNSTVEHGLAALERKCGSPMNNKHFNNHDITFEIHRFSMTWAFNEKELSVVRTCGTTIKLIFVT